jgi:hypothetical protein
MWSYSMIQAFYYPWEMKSCTHTKTCTWISIEALAFIAKSGNDKCPSTDKHRYTFI